MKVVVIIPARMESTRFPGKPLAKICGISMIEHVRRRVLLCKGLECVVVATCNQEIIDEVEAHGGRAVMTASTHLRCTDRIAEAARDMEADVVVNIQGDEPLIRPEMIEALLEPFHKDHSTLVTNLMVPISSVDEFQSRNAVKAAVDVNGNAMYFSREPIPTVKMGESGAAKFKQLGIYAFTKNFLAQYIQMAPTPLEIAESVDMLRIIENGHKLKMVALAGFPSIGVDIPSDIATAEALLKKDSLFGRY